MAQLQCTRRGFDGRNVSRPLYRGWCSLLLLPHSLLSVAPDNDAKSTACRLVQCLAMLCLSSCRRVSSTRAGLSPLRSRGLQRLQPRDATAASAPTAATSPYSTLTINAITQSPSPSRGNPSPSITSLPPIPRDHHLRCSSFLSLTISDLTSDGLGRAIHHLCSSRSRAAS